jgi:predicted Zn-dependent protease
MSDINWMEKLGWTDENTEDLRYTGFSYVRQAKYDIALPFFEALVVLEPDNAYDIQMLGALYLQLNQPEMAVPCFNRALELDTNHSPTLLNMAKALFMLGKVDEGLQLADALKNDRDKTIANPAKALILAYT